MAKKIQVILLEDVPQVGRVGEVAAVSEGYARNFLFPQGKAALATSAKTRQHQQKIDRLTERQTKALEELHSKAETLEGTELELPARVNEGESIYGSITAKHIADVLTKQTDLAISPRQVKLAEPLTTLGSSDVVIQLAPTVETTIRVTVVPEPDSKT